ncbi:nucleoside-diphosphate sugar epimerase/dehydratase [Stutzerimonas kirkiae]|uniref:LicD/FKTN/FKRP nucleotidyltransferase domain-containing protein n=1 Tax=Stutzerimonas kirkiae TaxID=2211392 RepID=A0A4Q9RE21_9GAMM|nr:LicD family protein [Stutzerimonas kirkiae]TBU99966.1 hypothetical protein DNJ96_01370 [Stutzerimonas kirkiae]TBV05672.1 hypothetical protein DNJ95_02040 [Stutzerimonas kirkiae]TBV10585.1 hypothetical protein DNK08_06020 [Stutzerimonas kirkiae]
MRVGATRGITVQDLQGKKIVLFGAGRSGEIFLESHRELQVLAFADNDPKKQGQALRGIPVIAPADIASTGCDSIVITTVYPPAEILDQLAALGLADIPLVVPRKAELKGAQDHPFSHPLTKRIARELVVAINELTGTNGVDVYLDYGTLLGAFREKDFIAWDDDIDMSVKEDHLGALVELVQRDKDWLPQHAGVAWSVQIVTAAEHTLAVLVSFDNAPGQQRVLPLELAITNRTQRDGQSIMSGKMLEFFCPAHFFDGYETVELFGNVFKTPVDAPGYLEFIYGNWREPRENMPLSEYQGIREVCVDQVEEIKYADI